MSEVAMAKQIQVGAKSVLVRKQRKAEFIKSQITCVVLNLALFM